MFSKKEGECIKDAEDNHMLVAGEQQKNGSDRSKYRK